jgi:hypothetical protein
MSIDVFFKRKYNRNNYNCAHFVCEVWQHITGENIAHKLSGLLKPADEMQAGLGLRRHFEKLKTPASPCIALMQRKGAASHVGLYKDGRILHIHEFGVEFQPVDVAARGFEKIGFYK